MLEVDSIDWHLLENAKAHRTDKYEMVHEESTPIFRRAQTFKLTIAFKNRAFNEVMDNIRLHFKYDILKEEPRIEALTENTTVTSSNKITNSQTEWSLKLEGQTNKTITLLVRSPPIAAWGTWNLFMKISFKMDPKVATWQCPTKFWLLFNPWAKDDDVYMPETEYLDEYILNDVGKVYTQGIGKPMGLKWIYGQFASPILKVLKKILETRHAYDKPLDEAKLGSPVELSKALLKIGWIIEGNWTDNFDGGTKPWLWTGSVPIYEEFLTTGEPAKYAQCFVYGAILTTALRAAGIPGRNISNFVSSTGGSETMSVNNVYDETGELVETEKIWNFHVWNDGWMARYDLPLGYGGWQALDCMGLGPASVQAIKKGELCLQYGVRYLLAECNSDRARWTLTSDNEYRLVSVDTAYIGRAMLTKQPFIYDPHEDTDFQDVSGDYKEKEGSREERLAIYNAMKYCKKLNKEFEDRILSRGEDPADYYLNPMYTMNIPLEESAVQFKLAETETLLFGEPLKAVLMLENVGEKPVTVEACLGCSSIYYNSAVAGLVKRERKSVTIPPKSNGEITLVIKVEEYAAKLVEFTLMKISCLATVKETNYVWANDFQFHVDMPEIIISAKKDLLLNKEGILMFQFKNVLKTKLTKCSITYEAPGIGRNVKFSCSDIKPDESVTIEHKVKPTRAGEILINANFNSKELNFLAGSSFIDVSTP